MASTFAYGVLPMEGPSSETIRGAIRLCSLRSLTQTKGLCGVQVGAQAASDTQLWNESTLRDAVFTNSIDISQQEPLPGDERAHDVFINRGQRICSQRVDDEAIGCSTSATGRAGLQLSPFSRQAMR